MKFKILLAFLGLLLLKNNSLYSVSGSFRTADENNNVYEVANEFKKLISEDTFNLKVINSFLLFITGLKLTLLKVDDNFRSLYYFYLASFYLSAVDPTIKKPMLNCLKLFNNIKTISVLSNLLLNIFFTYKYSKFFLLPLTFNIINYFYYENVNDKEQSLSDAIGHYNYMNKETISPLQYQAFRDSWRYPNSRI